MRVANRQSGASIVELASISILFVILALLCVDAGVLVMATSALDEAVRDAGRAAAETSKQADAKNAATQALKKHLGESNPVLKNLALVGDVVYEPYDGANKLFIKSDTGSTGLDGAPAGQMLATPFVRLTAGIDAVVPAPILFFGASFGKGGTLRFEQTATFPIIKLPVTGSGGVFDQNPFAEGGTGESAPPCPPGRPGCPPQGGGGPTNTDGSPTGTTGPPPGPGIPFPG